MPNKFRIPGGWNRDDYENPEDYEPGGLPPLEPGYFLRTGWRVIQKLGTGRISVVWMLTDGSDYVAAKLVFASRSIPGRNKKEVEVLRKLSSTEANPARLLVIPAIATRYSSANGNHNCQILPVMG
jgi:hypothetical protein